MNNRRASVHYARQFLQQFQQQQQQTPQLMPYLQQQLLPMLRRYPAMGRLLLNRATTNSELLRLNEQVCHQLSYGELREYHFEHCLVIYLVHGTVIYLLSCLPLSTETGRLWEQNSGY